MAEGEEPGDYISQRQDFHDCFFLVGRQKKERISTVRYFLANYSSYFRAMLLETNMKEKNSKEDIVIPDHEPDVFKLMLSYVYGLQDLKFKDVDQAMRFHILVDKCLMPKLKQISTNYLLKNCKSNLCNVLECVVLLRIKEMEPRAKQIVEKDTKSLLSSPDFLNTNTAIVEFIVKQEGLDVTEVELWRALVKWAKRQCGNTQEGPVLRKKINSIMKHVQFLKMTLKEFTEEVIPTAILTDPETVTVVVNMVRERGNTLKEPPSKTRKKWASPEPETFVVSLPLRGNNLLGYYSNYSSWICEYKIENLTPSMLRISSIKRVDMGITQNTLGYGIPHLQDLYGNGSISISVQLKSIDENSIVATKKFPVEDGSLNPGLISFPCSHILELSNDWIMKGSKNYILTVQAYKNGYQQSMPQRGNYMNMPVLLRARAAMCTVQLIYSNGQSSSLLNNLESITFSIVE